LRLQPGLCPRFRRGGAYTAPPEPLAGFKGGEGTSQRGGKGRVERRGGKGSGKRGKKWKKWREGKRGEWRRAKGGVDFAHPCKNSCGCPRRRT